MPSKKLTDCIPELQTKFGQLAAEFKREYPRWTMAPVCTLRSPEEQLSLFKLGRELRDGKWVVTDTKRVVTEKDGYKLKSRHNDVPARAVDVELRHPDGTKFWDTQSIAVGVGDTVCANPWLWLRDNARRFGLLNGGSWTTPKDFPHFQLV